MTWRRRHAFFRQKNNAKQNLKKYREENKIQKKAPSEISIYAPPWYSFFLLSTSKTPCLWSHRGTLRGHSFTKLRRASIAFYMQCGPNVWLTTLWRLRSCVCMACADAPCLLCGFCIDPWPSHMPVLSYSIKKQQLFPILMQAFLQVSVVWNVLCAPSFNLSIDLFLFLYRVCFLFVRFCHLVSFYISPVCCAAFSLLLCLLLAIGYCYIFKTVHFYTLAITLGQWRDCRHSLFKHVKVKDRDKKKQKICDVLLQNCQKSPHHLLFLVFLLVLFNQRSWLHSFDMRALVHLNVAPYLTQASHKSAQIE